MYEIHTSKFRVERRKGCFWRPAKCSFIYVPIGLLEKCFNAFYDSEVVSEEAFEEWVKSKDPEEQEGKGVCITSVQNFMRWLKEADEEG